MMARRAYWLVLSLVFMVGHGLLADTVLFNTANSGPGSLLQVDGITVSDLSGVNQPLTVSGYGLGDVAGPAGSYIISGNNAQSGLHLSVNGVFNSITILPFAVDQNGTPVALNFALSYEIYPNSGGPFAVKNIYLTGSSGPGTFAAPEEISLGTQSASIDLAAIDHGAGASEANFMATHPGVTSLTYGYVIVAADVTFVPEQSSTFLLLACAAGVICFVHRARRCA
jgi:hypothetical protein